jgi:GntR family transcriptional regulator
VPSTPKSHIKSSAIRMIDRSSPIPYYHQLQSILREGIEHGLWKPGDLLPSEATMISMFGISRTAIRRALDILQNEGIVFRVKGKGTLVTEPKFEFEAIKSQFPAWGTRRRRVQPPLLKTIIDARLGEAGGLMGQILEVQPNQLLFEITGVEMIHEVPSNIVQMYVRPDASDQLSALANKGEIPTIKEDGPELLLQLTKEYGLFTVESNMTLEAVTADDWQAGLLQIPPNTPILALSGVDLGLDRSPVAFSRTFCRSDQLQFSFRIHRSDI